MRTSIQPCRLGSLTRPIRPFRRPAQRPVAKAVPPTSTSTSTAHVATLESLVKAADADGDGKLTVQEVLALLQQQQAAPAALVPAVAKPPARPLTWDLHLLTHAMEAVRGTTAAEPTQASSSNNGSSAGGSKGGLSGLVVALASFLQTKLSNRHKNRALLSDVVWTFAGAFTAALTLGIAAQHVSTWPIVGPWHQKGLALLIGSFGTLSVLLFARPEAEPVKVWNLIAGHLLSITIVILVIQVMGATPVARATAMGLAIAAMLWTDSVHPPGGALVLLAIDNLAVQSMGWAYLLYPSLTFCALVMLPVGALTNWLKRNVRFDFPAKTSPGITWPEQSGSTDLKPKLA